MAEGDINLATLWIPVMPETSHIKSKMVEAGREGRQAFEQGFKESGALGEDWGSQVAQGFSRGLSKLAPMESLSSAFGGLSLESLGLAAGITGITVAAQNAVEALISVGEKFEDIDKQIELMTTDSGAALDELKAHANDLVSSLDTSTDKLGSTMTMLHQRLHMEAGPELDLLTKHLTELSDRFGQIDPSAFAGAMIQFNVATKDYDETLTDLMNTAREFDVNLPGLINTLAQSGPSLTALKLNADQAGVMIAELAAKGINAGSAIDALTRAQKAAGEAHQELAPFLQHEVEIIQHYIDTGNQAAADQEAYDLFGVRNWRKGEEAAQAYLDVVNKGPDALHKHSNSIDEVTEKTQKLSNAWDEFTNKLEATFSGPGAWAIDTLTEILHELSSAMEDLGLVPHHYGPPGAPATGSTRGFPAPAPFNFEPQLAPGPTGIPGVPTVPGAPPPVAGTPGSPIPGAQPPPGTPSIAPWDVGGGAAPSGYSGTHAGLWDRVAQAESSGNWSNADTGGNGHYGGLQFAPGTWALFGGTQFADRADHATREQQMTVADRTAFTGWAGAAPQGLGAWETITNGTVSVWRGGAIENFGGGAIGSGFVHGGQGGIDDIPARLTRGEFVVNAGAARQFKPALEWMNSKGFRDGGAADDMAGMTALDTQGAQVDTIAIGYAVERAFGLTDMGFYRSPDGYNEHSSGEAVDVMIHGDADMGYRVKDFALANAGNFGVLYALWHQTQWNPDGSTEQMANRGSATQNHMDHVHIRTAGGGFPQGGGPGAAGVGSFPSGTSTTAAPAVAAMTGGGGTFLAGWGSHGAGAPGAPPGLGPGGSPYISGTGETEEQARASQHRVDMANQRIGNLDRELEDARTRERDAEAALEAANNALAGIDLTSVEATKPGGLLEKRKHAMEQHQHAEERVTTLEQERGNALYDLNEATTRQREEAQRPPPRGREGRAGYGPEYGEAEKLGQGLLQGLAQELGFGDIMGKPPWEWGLWKLFSGLVGYGVGTANAWGDAISRAGGMPAGGGGGLGAGMLSSIPGVGNILRADSHGVSSTVTTSGQPGTRFGGPGGSQGPGPGIGTPGAGAIQIGDNIHLNVPYDQPATKVVNAVQNYQLGRTYAPTQTMMRT